jgi:D-xylose transport system permease protein
MRRWYLVLLILWVHFGDLFTAWLFDAGAFPLASLLRPTRDATVILIAAICLVTVSIPASLLIPILGYTLLAAIYMPVGWLYGLPPGILIGSFGTLMIPMLFFLVGYYCVREPQELRRMATLIVLIGVATALFGLWDIRHTEFWTQIIRFPEYMAKIKGVLPADTHPETRLPWNFYGGQPLARRSAGLLAAPLAQGTFLAVTALIAMALLQRRSLAYAGAVCTLLFIGLWMSGTRGAMLVGSVALLGYVASSRDLLRAPAIRLISTVAVLGIFAVISRRVVDMTLNFRDGSTIGHWTSLLRNLDQIHQVLLFGGGLGRQGAMAARAGLATLGGGEGAIFSMAFQMGIPAALLFLWFYGQCMRQLLHVHRRHNEALGLAMFWLACGMGITLVLSDNLLSVSACAAFWLVIGGVIRLGNVQRFNNETAGAVPALLPTIAHSAPLADAIICAKGKSSDNVNSTRQTQVPSDAASASYL